MSIARNGARFVFATFGSQGDLDPFLAIAVAAMRRGHRPLIATCAAYRARVESLGLEFAAVRPDAPAWDTDPGVAERLLHPRHGTGRLIREVLMPPLHRSYEDLARAAQGADLLVAHPLSFAAHLVADAAGIKWVSVALQPFAFFSNGDPPVLPGFPLFNRIAGALPLLRGLIFRTLKRSVRVWALPWHHLRAELGQPPASSPLFDDKYAAAMVLALFPAALARRGADWPARAVVTGFPFLEAADAGALAPQLERFLEAGPAPLVFTLGASSSMHAGRFFEDSVEAAALRGARAVLVLGSGRGLPSGLPPGVMAVEYAPFAQLFARACAVVHHGGMGTTALAMRAACPMLAVPSSFDQPDNARRVQRLGIARVLPRERYAPARVATELAQLVDDPRYRRRALEVAQGMRHENGALGACEALEGLLARS